MNERLKELAEQARLPACHLSHPVALQRFAQLVRDDERAKCAADYLQDCCDAVDAARLEEREACAKLCDDVDTPDGWSTSSLSASIRARGKPDPAFKHYMGDNWAGIV